MAKATWHTPIASLKNREEVWSRLENTGWGPINLGTDQPITYFNNPSTFEVRESDRYDRFFDYTRIFPLGDQRKTKDNIQFLPDIHENIFQQEKDKPIPALTSMTYGHRVLYDPPETGYRHLNAIGGFSRRRGVMRVAERKPQ